MMFPVLSQPADGCARFPKIPGNKKRLSLLEKAFLFSRDDWIRTSDPQHPMLIRYRTALRPELAFGV